MAPERQRQLKHQFLSGQPIAATFAVSRNENVPKTNQAIEEQNDYHVIDRRQAESADDQGPML